MSNYSAPNVTKIEFLDGMKIKLFFEGQTKVVDIANSDIPDRFPDLKQVSFFHKAKLDGGSIAWPNGLHLDLDELVYECPNAEETLPATGTFREKVIAALEKVLKNS